MSRPQQPEIARSGRTDVDPDHAGEALEGNRAPRSTGKTGPVPAENQPGHHPPEEQDKPDLDAFAARLSADEPREAEVGSGEKHVEAPYMRWVLFPGRLLTHVAKWSREYFRDGRH